jgi:micrococcal nuclease
MNAKRTTLLIVLILAASNCLQEPHSCVFVVDGDTFELDSGEVIRLIGADAPELSELGGDTARDYLSSLILNKEITLRTGTKERDTYGRLLKYVYIGNLCINEEMIRNGYAEARYLSADDPNHNYYLYLEMEAEKKKVGLWQYTIFQPRQNLNWEDNMPIISWKNADKYYGQYVIVEGTITYTYNSGSICVLGFHSELQKYVTAVIFAFDFPYFPGNLEDYYLGKNVQIIGIIREYKGSPEIIAKTPEQIKIIEPL